MVRHLIIGNSAAGITAAEILRRLDGRAGITVVSDEAEPAYSRCLLPDFLAGRKTGADLRIRPADFYAGNRIDRVSGRVLRVDPRSRQVLLENGGCLDYDRLLIATGARSAFPPVPGLSGPNVTGLRTMADARKIVQLAGNVRRVLVVGAGFVGLETAYALYNRGLEVTVVEKMPQILPGQFDATAAGILQRDMHAEGMRIILGAGIKEVLTPSGFLNFFNKSAQGVLLDNGDRLKADLIVVAAGIRPNVELVQDTGISTGRGITVDQFMRTSVPGVYAAGDVAETEDVVTGRVGLTPIWPNAVSQGKTAAWNMAGQPRPCSGSLGMQNAVEFREIPSIAMGITQGGDPGLEVMTAGQPGQNVYRKLVLRDNVIVGMILVGDISGAGVIGALIRKHADVRKFKDDILRGRFNYGYMLAEMRNAG